MNPLNPLFAVIVMTIACITGYIINLKAKTKKSNSRFETIDGLRGFLALAVFIHHSTIWHQFIHEGTWRLPDSNLYIHFGETSVALFFMITSFLFVTKLINTKEHDFNWNHFFISRFFRIVPMYFFSLLLIILTVMQMSDWILQVDLLVFLKSIMYWLAFTLSDMPYINNYNFTDKINAGVTWSLWYEWLFYFSLPIFSLLISYKKPKLFYVIISIVFILFFFVNHILQLYQIYAFAGGALAAYISKFVSINTKLKDYIASVVVIICLLLIRQFNTSKNDYCIILTSITFTLIASGTSVFGILKLSIIKFLGDISYSVYLLHGIILFSVFHFIISFENIKTYTPSQFSMLIFAITPLVILLSYLGYRFIEKPAMDKSKKIIQNLQIKKA
ncbi:MAG: acyltransferase [Bacteroidia bacterium]|nr:acyltransferase [Bacteroidia bacterium]